MIHQKNISKISNNIFKQGGRRIPESIIERDYCLSWFLFGLSRSPLKESLVFKGGTALRRCYFKDYRFSEDLDYTLVGNVSLDEILKHLDEMFFWIKDESGILFATGRREVSSQNTHTFYLNYIGPLPGKEKEVKVDVTFKEIIIRPLEERSIIRTYEEYDDFLEEQKVRVYSLDEVIIEKTCALFSMARNEPRDLFDMYYLIENEKINMNFLIQDVQRKMLFKNIVFEKIKNEFLKKELRLKKLWEKRLAQQMIFLPEYENVFRVVKRAYRQAGLI